MFWQAAQFCRLPAFHCWTQSAIPEREAVVSLRVEVNLLWLRAAIEVARAGRFRAHGSGSKAPALPHGPFPASRLVRLKRPTPRLSCRHSPSEASVRRKTEVHSMQWQLPCGVYNSGTVTSMPQKIPRESS
jgi:hypothetical protein